MCGICGIVGTQAADQTVQAMCATLEHRGPDDSGCYVQPGVAALGMRRLSIIDVAGGQQPIFNEDRSLAIVFNGEIYNFPELRVELEAAGHRFATRSDTEVVLHGYEAYGTSVFERLAGMFAVALWDNTRRQLILARDRLGIKPLYYTWANGQFIFGSEIKSLLAISAVQPLLDLIGLDGYLTYQYVPAPRTMFRDVRKLLPGHWLTLGPGNTPATSRPYWRFKFEPSGQAATRQEWVDSLAAALRTAVRRHLLSEVPLGAFLSGGLDSSTVVALMSEVLAQPVKTFTIGFEGRTAVNELEHARVVAQHLGTEHHELTVTPDLAHQLPQLVWNMDEPLGDPAALPTYFVSRLAKDCGVTVVMSGEGADEMFGGYPKYRQDRYLRWYQGIPASVRRALIPPVIEGWPAGERYRRILRKAAAASTAEARTLAWRQVAFPDHYRAELYQPEVATEVGQQTTGLMLGHLAETAELSDLRKMLLLDTLSWLPDDLLMKVDRMSMAASVEARVPYLDNGVVTLAAQMPDAMKVRGGTLKYVLKQVARSLLPASITERRKQGFELPLGEWLRGDLGRYFEGLILSGALQSTGLFRQSYLEELLRQHAEANADHGVRLWSLANLSLWFERFSVSL